MDSINAMDRRQAIKWMLTAAAAIPVIEPGAFAATPGAMGYGTDPNLMESYKPGDLWPLTFTSAQRQTTTALCDVIIPADDRSPSATKVGVPSFIDEWVSAPYPRQQRDRVVLLDGLKWLEAESKKRFQKDFASLTLEQQHQICDDICHASAAKSGFKKAAGFFAVFRNLTCAGFYTTPEGMKDIQYIGNVPMTKYDGPSPEALAYLRKRVGSDL